MEDKRDDTINKVVTQVEMLCKCGFTSDHVDTDVSGFRCTNNPIAVAFRGRLSNTEKATASELISYIQQWISNGVSISILGLIFDIDPMCTVAIEMLSDPICEEDSTATGEDSTATSDSSSGLSVGAIAGGTVAGVTMVTMVVIAGVVGVLLWMRCHTRSGYQLR